MYIQTIVSAPSDLHVETSGDAGGISR
jgi:hypothetical protein